MKGLWVWFVTAMIFIVMTTCAVSAAWWSQQDSYQSSSGCDWNFWGGGCYQQQSESHSTSSGGGWGPEWYGGLYSNYYSSFSRSNFWTNWWANGTQIADVSGIWKTDLLGNLTLKLTGDDIIRASYKIKDKNGYMQGNFSSNSSPIMEGFWWEEPEYRPPYQAGAVQITFENSTAFSGIFAYADGTWGPFTGTKIRANLTVDEDDALMDMPQLDWNIDVNQVSDKRVNNPVDTNPIQNS